ncbi:hypothetical protein DRH14_02225, partial [Candidatus Shapirobacteria bacterium]
MIIRGKRQQWTWNGVFDLVNVAGEYVGFGLIGVFFFEKIKFFFVGGITTHTVVKFFIPFLFFYLWKQRVFLKRELLTDFRVFLLLLFSLSSVFSAYFSSFPEDSLRELYILFCGIVVCFFMALFSLKKVNFNKMIWFYIFLLLFSGLFRLLIVLKQEWLIGLISVSFKPEIAQNFIYHLLIRRQLMFLDVGMMIFPLSLVFALVSRGVLKYFFWFLYLLSVFSIILANSRTYFINLLVGSMIVGFYFFLKKKNLNINFFVVMILSLLALFSFGVSSRVLGSNVMDRLLFTYRYDKENLSGRRYLAERSVYVLKNFPFFGSGQRTLPKLIGYEPDVQDRSYINFLSQKNLPESYGLPTAYSFFNVLAEMGIIGFVLWLLMLFTFVIYDVFFLLDGRIKNHFVGLYLSFAISALLYTLTNVTDVPTYPEQMSFWIIRGML